MRRLLHFILPALTLTLIACSSPPKKTEAPAGEVKAAPSERSEQVPLVGSLQAQRYQLENGLKLIVVEDHSSPTFAYNTWFDVGSRDEQVGRTGLAHLFEHMMFKETKTLKEGEFDRTLESAGAEGENAFTSRDYTAYVEEMPRDKLELIVKLEADRMVNLVVNDKAFKTETEVVQNERRFRNENSPDGLMYQELFGVAFTKHPYHWPVIGYQKDLESMTGADARTFYKSYYSPNHATIVVVGDVKTSDVLALVKKYYGSYAPQADLPREIMAEPPQKSPRRKVLKLNVQVEKLMMGYHIPSVMSEQMATITVMRTVLTSGKSSRLHRALVETGIASVIEAFDLDDKDPSLLVFAANLQKKKKASQAESVILKEIERLKKEPISPKELERAKNTLMFQFYESLSDNSEKARFIGQYETIAKGFEHALAMFQKTRTVTSEDIQKVATEYLDPRNRSVIVGVSK